MIDLEVEPSGGVVSEEISDRGAPIACMNQDPDGSASLSSAEYRADSDPSWARVFSLIEEHGAMTLEQVGEAFGLTRERIRQIEKKALANLRRAALRAGLRLEDMLTDGNPHLPS